MGAMFIQNIAFFLKKRFSDIKKSKSVRLLLPHLNNKYSNNTEDILSFLKEYNQHHENEDLQVAQDKFFDSSNYQLSTFKVCVDAKPFQIASWRDSSLFPRHMIQSARNLIKNNFPMGFLIKFMFFMLEWIMNNVFQWKLIFGEPFVAPFVKPKKFYYQKPIFYNGNHNKSNFYCFF